MIHPYLEGSKLKAVHKSFREAESLSPVLTEHCRDVVSAQRASISPLCA